MAIVDSVTVMTGHTSTKPNPMHTNMTSSMSVVEGELRSEQVAKMLPSRAAIHWPVSSTLACCYHTTVRYSAVQFNTIHTKRQRQEVELSEKRSKNQNRNTTMNGKSWQSESMQVKREKKIEAVGAREWSDKRREN